MNLKKESTEMIEKYKEKDIKKNGRTSAYIERTNYLVEKYKTALFFIFVQLLVILFLIFGYLNIKSNTVVEVMLPKVLKDTDYGKLKIGINGSNKLYYKIFGSYISEMVLNSNKKNVVQNTDILKELIYPEVLSIYSKKIDNFQRFVVNNDAELKYTQLEESISINENKEGVYLTKGHLKTRLGVYNEKDSICTVEVKMVTKSYMLFVTSFVKHCSDINNTKEAN